MSSASVTLWTVFVCTLHIERQKVHVFKSSETQKKKRAERKGFKRGKNPPLEGKICQRKGQADPFFSTDASAYKIPERLKKKKK